jgi:catechol-2,3-dioxygenase
MSAVTEERVTATRRLDDEFPGRVTPNKLGHVVFMTTELARARSWYLNVFNARIAVENEQVCFMTYDDEHHRLGFIKAPNLIERPRNSLGLEHFAFSYSTLGALLAQYKYLKTQGITPFWTINYGPTMSFFYRDPDGNKIEFFYDVYETPAQVNAFYSSDAYKENFMGIIFEPEELIANYEAGVPLKELVHRPPLPPGKTPWDMHRG